MNPVVYRFFDSDDHLLYIGSTSMFMRRLIEHQYHATFFADIARVTLEHHETKRGAEAAERLAIATEMPLHNVQHKPRKPITYVIPADLAAQIDARAAKRGAFR